ncbi:MAG: CBS domain-containing protein [Actinomycetota bacterium]|jgi:CBS domain-containing protein|nr:CBS domain-containing protein [Actinomycetota bacterium]
MRIGDLLEQKGSAVVTIDGNATVAEAIAALARHGIGALVVSADGEHIDGILSERDVVRHLDHERKDLLDRPVKAIMSTPVHTVEPGDEVAAVMAIMTNERVRHLPVTGDGVLVGIVSIGDVVKHTIEQLERDRKLLEDYITAR